MTDRTIDLRSDTVTRPTPAMYQAMATAALGDDVYGDDPTINELQRATAERLGFEAALYVTSGTQSNLTAVLTHCGRGDEYITGDQYHVNRFEGGGGAVFGAAVPAPLPVEPDGTLDLARIEAAIKGGNVHFADSRLLSLENTHTGRALSLDFIAEACALARRHGLATHLDGARLFNAATKLGVDVKEITQHFDSVSLCLSKGLCAPVGSVLCASTAFIARARKWRKMLGGGLRQSGVLAACGLVSLNEMSRRLAEDHDNAAVLADRLRQIDGLAIDFADNQTNMVFAEIRRGDAAGFRAAMKGRDVLLGGDGARLRLVLHNDVSRADVHTAADAMGDYFRALNAA